MADIKGSSISGTRAFVTKRFGDDGLARLMERLPEDAKKSFEGVILQNRWYPTAHLVSFMREADALFGKGDLALCEEMGRYSAWEQLSLAYKIMVFAMSTEAMVNRIPTMWKTFYNHGRIEVVEMSKSHVVVRVHELGVEDAAFCRRFVGWMTVVGEKTGGKNAQVVHSECHAQGAPYCEFRGTWG